MKYYVIIACISFLTLTNCSLDQQDNGPVQRVRVLWNLKNVSGGVAGVDNDFASGKVVWEFDDDTGVLKVTNTNTDTTIEDGLDSGNYTYARAVIDGKEYIKINGTEFASLKLTVNSSVLTLNQNETSTGPASDGYIYTFDKTIIAEN